MSGRGAFGELLAGLPVDAQPTFWDGLDHASQLALVHLAPALHPVVLTDALESGSQEVAVALGGRYDLPAEAYQQLLQRPNLHNVLEDNLIARPLIGRTGPVPRRRALHVARRQPLPTGAAPALLTYPDSGVRVALASNPTLSGDQLWTVLTGPHDAPGAAASASVPAGRAIPELVAALLVHPAAGTDLQVAALRAADTDAARDTRDSERAATKLLAALSAAARSGSCLPALIAAGTATSLPVALCHLSALTAAGQAALAHAVLNCPVVAGEWAGTLSDAAGLDRQVRVLLDRSRRASVSAAERDQARDALAELAAGGDWVAAQPGTADPQTLLGELRDGSWGRLPLWSAAAPQLPWAQVTDQVRALSGPTIAFLLDRPEHPEDFVWGVASTAPGLLVERPEAKPEHVLAELRRLSSQFGWNDTTVGARQLVRWGLVHLNVQPAAVVAVVASLPILCDVLDDLPSTPEAAAWRSGTLAFLAAQLSDGAAAEAASWTVLRALLAERPMPVSDLVTVARATSAHPSSAPI